MNDMRVQWDKCVRQLPELLQRRRLHECLIRLPKLGHELCAFLRHFPRLLLSRLSAFLNRLPVWLWLLLAASQALNIAASSNRLSHALFELEPKRVSKLITDKGIVYGAEAQAMEDEFVKSWNGHLESYRRHQWETIVSSGLFGPFCLFMAWRRWMRTRVT
jgi:hypothetical protein